MAKAREIKAKALAPNELQAFVEQNNLKRRAGNGYHLTAGDVIDENDLLIIRKAKVNEFLKFRQQ